MLALPAVLPCPFCKNHRLHITKDPYYAGEWAYCTNCEFHGDMIELAARTWKLDLRAAVDKLAVEFPLSTGDVDKYLIHNVAPRTAVSKFWARCRTRMSDRSVEINNLAIDWHCSPSRQHDWPRLGSRLIGAAARDDVQELSLEIGTLRPPGDPAFKHVLIHPYYDAPGRVCAIRLLGAGKDALLNLRPYNPGHPHIKQLGVTMLDLLLQPTQNRTFAGELFLLDWRLALELQLQHLRASSVPLPIVAPLTWSPQPVLRTIGRRTETIIPDGDTIDTAMLQFSKKTDARLAVIGRGGLTERTLSNRQAVDWLHAARQTRTTWHPHAANALLQHKPEAVPTAIQQMELTPDDRDAMLHRCDVDVREHLERILPQTSVPWAITVDRRPIVEQGDAWYCHGERIFDGLIRVDRVVEAGADSRLQGVYKNGELVVPFLLRINYVRRVGLFQAMAEHVQSVTRRWVIFSPVFNKQGLQIATRFRQPTVVAGTLRVGWDERDGCFRFPEYCLTGDGRVETDTVLLATDEVPAIRLPQPGFMSGTTIEYLSDDRATAPTTWGVALVTLQSVLSPVLRLPNAGAVVVGPGHHSRWIAESLGCCHRDLKHAQPTENQFRPLVAELVKHDWPAWLLPISDTAASVWVNTAHGQSLLVGNEYLAAAAAVRGWHTILDPNPQPPPSGAAEAARHILPNYLQDLCRRRFSMRGDRTPLGLLQDVAEWWYTATERKFPLTAVCDRLPRLTLPPHECLRQLLHQTACPVEDKQTAVRIDQHEFRRSLQLHGAAVLELQFVSNVLRNAGVLITEDIAPKTRSWFVEPTWYYRKDATCFTPTTSTSASPP